MLDFPANPSSGQVFSSGDTTWMWDGVKWTVSTQSTSFFLPLSGGTLTGDLVISKSFPTLTLDRQGGPTMGQGNNLGGTNNGARRWLLNLGDVTPESGGNSGSDFGLSSFSDASAILGQPLTVRRRDGVASVNGNGATPYSLAASPGSAVLNINKSGPGFYNVLNGLSNGVPRWQFQLGDATPESGSNAGSSFVLASYDDSGNPLKTALSIDRLTATATFGGTATCGGVNVNGPNNSNRVMTYTTSGSMRWLQGCLADVETGGNAGSDWGLYAYNDSGAQIGPLFIAWRSNLSAAFYGMLTVEGALVANSTVSVASTLNVGGYSNLTGFMSYGSSGVDADFVVYGTTTVQNCQANGSFYAAGNMSCNGEMVCNNALITYNQAIVYSTFTCYGNGNIAGQLNVGSVLYCHPLMNIYSTGSDSTMQLCDTANARFQFDWQASTNSCLCISNTTGALFYLDGGGNFLYNEAGAYKIGGGTWYAASDARIKEVTGDYNRGLADVLKLQPRTFFYKGNDTDGADVATALHDPRAAPLEVTQAPYPASVHYQVAQKRKPFIGFVAQELEPVFPEMIVKRHAFIDGKEVDDLKNTDTGPLIYALVNAVKEMSARIEALEQVVVP
jgi:Chaperone of endosialidase